MRLCKRQVACQPVTEPFHVSWEWMKDVESGVHAIEWSLGMSELGSDVMPKTRVESSLTLSILTIIFNI